MAVLALCLHTRHIFDLSQLSQLRVWAASASDAPRLKRKVGELYDELVSLHVAG
jgi:hypothetical protein